jgi:uncharacterized protein YqeY
MENLFKKINEDLQAAMKAKDIVRLETLRMMKSKILNVNARGDLPEAELIKILSKYSKSLRDSIEEFKKVNRPDAVAAVEGEIKIIGEYLPRQLSEDEVRDAVKKAIAEIGASSAKEKGLVIKKVVSENSGVDGGVVSRLVSEVLK